MQYEWGNCGERRETKEENQRQREIGEGKTSQEEREGA